MPNVMQLLPEIDGEEMMYLQNIMKDYSDQQAQQFAMMYRSRRRDPQTILLVTIVGFLGIAGIQRFMTDQIGMGILYFFTAGLCFIGTIVDLINHKKIALDFNQMQAQQIAMMVKSST
ncbi:MAG: TM2 domain-containing protein [Bacteroidetes bacterium]|nr:TM2 domain-containing protein [Bacteroidota bacterium]MCW5897148.1 TM2 domain-containing protein [Bacteroidota bacterium]